MRRNFADSLNEELILARMSQSLKGWLCGDLRNVRNAVYKAAGFTPYQIKTYGDRAYEIHLARLRAYSNGPTVLAAATETIGTAIVFGAIGYFAWICLAPSRAYAAEVTPMSAGREWLTFVLIAIAAIVIWLGVSRPEPKTDDDERPHGDTTGYGRDPKGRF